MLKLGNMDAARVERLGALAAHVVEHALASGLSWDEAILGFGIAAKAPSVRQLPVVTPRHALPSAYAKAAKDAGLKIITWSLERSGPLVGGGGYYYQSIADAVHSDGVMYQLVDVLARDVGVVGIFSDWPATVSFYASCMGLQ